MKNLEFKDYTGVVKDADGDEHSTTVRAAVVTDETARVKNDQGNPIAREVMTPTGARPVAVGDVLVETDRPGVYDYLTADAWASTGYATGASVKASDEAVAPDDEDQQAVRTDPVAPDDATGLRKLPSNDNNA